MGTGQTSILSQSIFNWIYPWTDISRHIKFYQNISTTATFKIKINELTSDGQAN